MSNNELPASVKLLFNNPYLDMMSLLVALYNFKNQKSGISLRQLTYYYSVATSFDFDELTRAIIGQSGISNLDIANVYFDVQKDLKKIILELDALKLCSLIYDTQANISCAINEKGIEIVSQLKNSYFKELTRRLNFVKKELKYNVHLEKIMMGVKR